MHQSRQQYIAEEKDRAFNKLIDETNYVTWSGGLPLLINDYHNTICQTA